MIASLRPIVTLWKLAFYRWAQREMCASHPDAPKVTLRLRELQDQKGSR